MGHHVVPIASLTDSGIPFLKWTKRVVRRLEEEGLTSHWMFVDESGTRATASRYQDEIFTRLEDIQQRRPDLIEPSCDVREDYGVQRSGRRFLRTVAKIRGVPDDLVELLCRWSTDKNRQGRAKFSSMEAAYLDYRQARGPKLKVTQMM